MKNLTRSYQRLLYKRLGTLLFFYESANPSLRAYSQFRLFRLQTNRLFSYLIIAMSETKSCAVQWPIFLYLHMSRAFPIHCKFANAIAFLKALLVIEYIMIWVRVRKSAYIKNIQVIIVLVSFWAEYNMSWLSLSRHIIWNAEHVKEDSGSSSEMMIDW